MNQVVINQPIEYPICIEWGSDIALFDASKRKLIAYAHDNVTFEVAGRYPPAEPVTRYFDLDELENATWDDVADSLFERASFDLP